MQYLIFVLFAMSVNSSSKQQVVNCDRLVTRTTSIPNEESPYFRVGKSQTVKCEVSCLEKYQVILESSNAVIMKLDGLNTFQIKPTTKVFKLDIYIDVGLDTVKMGDKKFTGKMLISNETFLCK